MMRVINSEKTIEDYIARFHLTDFLNEKLLQSLQLFYFPAHSYVCTAGDDQAYLYFLVEGQVQCSHYHVGGKLAVMALCNPFAAIGDLEILNREPLNSDVIATRNTTMLAIDSETITFYGADDPRFLRFLIGQIKEKLYKANTMQLNQMLPMINRLVIYLLAQGDHSVILPDKENLALMLGTTTRHLNRVLKELVEQGSISSGYPLVRILNRQALEEQYVYSTD